MGIEIIGEDKTPRLICGRCKNMVKIDIRPFQGDITRLAKIVCPHCRTEIFCGVLVMGNTDVKTLLSQIQEVIDLFSKAGANVEKAGAPGANVRPIKLS